MRTGAIFPRCFLGILILVTLTDAVPTMCGQIQMPFGCQCQTTNNNDNNPATIKCSGLTEVPNIVVSGNQVTIYELDLSNNYIDNITDGAFQGNYKIQRINLEGNQISAISVTAFAGIEGTLLELKLTGDEILDIRAVLNSTKLLMQLQVLYLSNFRAPNNNLEERGMFSFPNLRELKLEGMKLIYIDQEAFNLANLNKILLNNNHFENLPLLHHTLVNIEHLEIKDNKIHTIPFHNFERNIKVKFFDISRNNITKLDPECFFNVENVLQVLILDGNPIKDVSVLEPIKTLSALESLRLERTGLREIPVNPTFMQNKQQLKYLYLNENQLTSLPSGLFSNTGYLLEKLDLSHNQLPGLPQDFFTRLSSLTDLLLVKQTISGTFSLPSLMPLTNLQQLNLEQTKLNTSEIWNAIPHLKNLKSLNLDSTGITEIKDSVFWDLRSLKELSLQENQISTLTDKSFLGLKEISHIYLGTNQISEISQCVFYEFSSTLTISLIANPLHCDCKLAWLKTSVSEKKINFATSQEKCQSPASNANKRFVSVDYADFVCDVHVDLPVCVDYYQSTTTMATTTSPSTTTLIPDVIVTFTIEEVTLNSLTLKFSAAPLEYVKQYVIEYENMNTLEKESITREKNAIDYRILRLTPSTNYEVCVRAQKTNNQYKSKCLQRQTLADPQATTTVRIAVAKKDDTGIIIGASIGGVILFALLLVILYLLIFKRRNSKNITTGASPVKVVKRPNLPTIGYDSKRFGKKKKQNGHASSANNDNAINENIQVAVISDGQNNQQSTNLGRISAGSYQFLDEGRKVNIDPETGGYMNSNDMRPLPSTPRNHQAYQNEAFQRSPTRDTEPHPYSEINLENPV